MDIKVIEEKKEIVITKDFAKRAETFQSDEYKLLREAKTDNPTFKVVINKPSKRETHKGLTFEWMRSYIEKHGDGNGKLMSEFEALTKNDDGIQSVSYGAVREWFLTTFPEVDDVYEMRRKIIERVKRTKEELKKSA